MENADDMDIESGDPAAGSSSQTVRKNISLKLKTRTGKGRGRKATRGRKASPRKPAKVEDDKMEHDGDGSEEEREISQTRECVLPAMKPITGVSVPLHRQQHLRWNHKVRLIGEKVVDPTIHCCEKCSMPILIYGRMIPCKHVFCLDCAKRTKEKNCPRCEDPVQRIEQAALGTVFVCTHGGNKHDVAGCRRTYLSQRDLQAHYAHRHEQKPPKPPEPVRAPSHAVEDYKVAPGAVSSVTPVLEMLKQTVRGPPPQVPQAQLLSQPLSQPQPVSMSLPSAGRGQPLYRPPNSNSMQLQVPPPGQHPQLSPNMPPPPTHRPNPQAPQPAHPALQGLAAPQGPPPPAGQTVPQPQHMQPALGGQIESYHTIPVMARTNLITVPLQEERSDFRRDHKPVAYVNPQGHQAMGYHQQQTPPGGPPPTAQHYSTVSQAPVINTAGPPVSYSLSNMNHPPPGYNMSGPPPRGPPPQGPPPSQGPPLQGNVPVSHPSLAGTVPMPHTGSRPPMTQPPPMNSPATMGHPGGPMTRPGAPLLRPGAPMSRAGAPGIPRPGVPMQQVGAPPPQRPPQPQFTGARPRFENQSGNPPYSQPGGNSQRPPWPSAAPGGPPGPRSHGPPGPSGPPPRGPPPVRPPSSQGNMGPPPPRPYYQ